MLIVPTSDIKMVHKHHSLLHYTLKLAYMIKKSQLFKVIKCISWCLLIEIFVENDIRFTMQGMYLLVCIRTNSEKEKQVYYYLVTIDRIYIK